LNYVEATGVDRHGAGIEGVRARDAMDGRLYRFASRVVCNCAGPGSAVLAERFDRHIPDLFHPSIAFNVLLDRDPPCSSAVAVTPRRADGPSGPTYFLYPAFGGLLAGTAHAPSMGPGGPFEPDEAQIDRFLADLNVSIPGLDVRLEHVVRVFSGLLPVDVAGTTRLSVRPVIRNHGQEGGPQGLVSVSGVKFTTARRIAEQTLAAVGAPLGPLPVRRDTRRPPSDVGFDVEGPAPDLVGPAEAAALQRMVKHEAVMTIDDLLYRRTNWAITARDMGALRRRIAKATGLPAEGERTVPGADGLKVPVGSTRAAP
jgi:glycerol-3-phosphate dehydrogenase